jgi:hypothetical protein
VIGRHVYQRTTPQGEVLQAAAAVTGWFSLQITAQNLPPVQTAVNYRLSVTYEAPQEGIGP